MKSLRLLLVLLGPVLFFGCSKEKSFEVGNTTTVSQWEFTEGSNFFKGNVDTAYVNDLAAGIKSLILEGTSDNGSGFLNIAVLGFNPSAPGVYKTPSVLFDYSNASRTIYENDLTAVNEFTLEVTKIDSSGITGIFSGKVKDSTGGAKTITSGKFSAKLGGSIQPPAKAQLTFWSKASCAAGGNITVKLNNNQTGTITTFNTTAPACGANGSANFTLDPGVYTFVAKCGPTDSVSGTVLLQPGQCVRTEVSFGAAPANGEATFWAKNSCNAGGNITVRLSNSQTGTITAFTPTAPANCTGTGTANFTLPAGSYTWVAKCGPTDSVSGNLTVTASQCSKVEVVFPTGGPAQYTLVSAGGNCSNTQVLATYTVGKALGDTNDIVVQVNVTTIGAYSIATNTINGYSFSGTGNFTTTGVQNVTLQGIGTPLASGTNSFTVTAGASSCSNVNVPVVSAPASTLNTWSFTQGTRTYSGTFPTGGDFGDDWLGFGKSLDMFGEIPSTDTAFSLYIQFPASATQPVPGTYTTNPDIFNSNTNDLYMFDSNVDIFYVKDFPPLPPTTPTLTIIITSYDASTKIAKGTFSGTAWNSAGTIVNITNGKFEAEVHF